MAKRGAENQLTDRNWDAQEQPEEAGHFQHAGHEEISKRVIKRAKRRVAESSGGFKGFQGFGSPAVPSSSLFLTTASTLSAFKGFGSSTNMPEKNATSCAETAGNTHETSGGDAEYLKQVKALNHSVCEWIKKHVSQDPYVDLTPVFRDYEKHMADIDKKFSLPNKTVRFGANLTSGASSEQLPASSVTPSVFAVSAGPLVTSTPIGNGNQNDAGRDPSSVQENGSKSCDTEMSEDAPKVESQVKSSPEEGSFYSIRCKLFFKRASSWAELGVGMLSLKKIDNKTQVLVRNDTALGKILLNVFLGEATPISRSGKNNVLLMSVPNPPIFTKESDGDNSKPVSYLIRVKTSENADELHKHMEGSKST